MSSKLSSIPRYRLLPRLYRLILSATRLHGLFTLSRFHYRHFGGAQAVDIPGGSTLFIPDDPHYFGFLAGVHEPHVAEVIRSVVKPGSTCLDVGANIGYFAMIMAQSAGTTGRVIAFEPAPETYVALQTNEQMAMLAGLNIEAHQVAVSDQVGELIIERQEHSTLNQVRAADSPADSPSCRVKCVPLAVFLEEHGVTSPITLLKVDVEGHELAVVKGALSAMKSGSIRHLILEVTPGNDAKEIDQILRSCDATTLIWRDRAWRNEPIGELIHRTDILATFPHDIGDDPTYHPSKGVSGKC